MSLKDNYIKLTKKFGGTHTLINKGLTQSTITSILKGCDIGVTKAYNVAKVLGVTMEELLTGSYEEKNVYTPEEKELINKLINILRGTNKYNKKAIIENIEAFYKTHNINLPIDQKEHHQKKQKTG